MSILSPIGTALNKTGDAAAWTTSRANDGARYGFGTVDKVSKGTTNFVESVNNDVFNTGRSAVRGTADLVGGAASNTLGPVGDVINGTLHVGSKVADTGLGLVQGTGNLALGTARQGVSLLTDTGAKATGLVLNTAGTAVSNVFHALGSLF
jgi:hypothetical protein